MLASMTLPSLADWCANSAFRAECGLLRGSHSCEQAAPVCEPIVAHFNVEIRKLVLTNKHGIFELGKLLKSALGCDISAGHSYLEREATLLGGQQPSFSERNWPKFLQSKPSRVTCDGKRQLVDLEFNYEPPVGPMMSRFFDPRWYQSPNMSWPGRMLGSRNFHIGLSVTPEGRLISFNLDVPRTSI
jgi:hypothetical protein